MKSLLTVLLCAISLNALATDPVRLDLNKPVTNPELSSILVQMRANPSDETKDALLLALNKANYLVPSLLDDFTLTEPDKSGVSYTKPGAVFKIYSLPDGKGGHYLPLFTDITELKKSFGKPTNVVIFSPTQAWIWALNGQPFTGALVNPSGDALPLGPGLIKFLWQRRQASATP